MCGRYIITQFAKVVRLLFLYSKEGCVKAMELSGKFDFPPTATQIVHCEWLWAWQRRGTVPYLSSFGLKMVAKNGKT
jgi:hypothetical protein